MLTLYFSPMACSLAARMALYEAGLDARFVQVDLKAKTILEDNQTFTSVNSLAKVPVLERPDGERLTEMAALLQFIADAAPSAGLAPLPGDPARYRLQQWLSYAGTELHKGAAYPIYNDGFPDGIIEVARRQAARALPAASRHLADRDFLLGARFTVADAYLVWVLLVLRHAGIEVDESLRAYVRRAMARPAVSRATTEEQALFQAQSQLRVRQEAQR